MTSRTSRTSRDTTPPPPAGTDLGLVDAIAQLSFLVQNTLAEIAGEYDLSLIQTRLLGVLRDREPTMNELGRHLGLDKSSITGLVARAQRRDLVTRSVSTIDRRVAQVSITEAGRELIERVAERFAERIQDTVAPLAGPDQQEFSRLASQIVTSHMHRQGIDPGTAAVH
ncbi:MarR family winged helix-turn-helix transcriptional regulator [Streptacidiphilus sp. N1-12]|uniref:MarR family winged helix-turn-helix transcriptional regulator n=2 Tax=Streptacidiphilus alkalitolerans TaxID=3342712 RepID=A0ABV6V500_9ACTN